VVFSNEQDLKKHRLQEHNEQLSRNERRAALQIPVNLTVRFPSSCLAARLQIIHSASPPVPVRQISWWLLIVSNASRLSMKLASQVCPAGKGVTAGTRPCKYRLLCSGT